MSEIYDELANAGHSFVLLCLIVLFCAVLVYALWPANRETFRRAARSILEKEDKPWR
jgi:cytochrome c oxidase cbb3-type subunit IV